MTEKEVREMQQQKKSEKREHQREEKEKDEISAVYTFIRRNGPSTGPEIQEEFSWGREKRTRVVKEAISQGVLVYEGPSRGRFARLVISE